LRYDHTKHQKPRFGRLATPHNAAKGTEELHRLMSYRGKGHIEHILSFQCASQPDFWSDF